jgi:uncharacterized protein (DUF952 family)
MEPPRRGLAALGVLTGPPDRMRTTYHLTPAAWWKASDPHRPLGAPSLDTEGFIHCTDGALAMVATANRHYRDHPGDFVVLTIDLDRVSSRWTVEDDARIYPHVFGPIDRAAIVGLTPAPRAEDGTFLPFAD